MHKEAHLHPLPDSFPGRWARAWRAIKRLLRGQSQDEGLDMMADRGEIGPLREALIAGASPHGAPWERHFPAFFAAQGGHEACLRVLLDAGANPHARFVRGGSSLLMVASAHGGPAVVALLLERGLDPNLRDEFGTTAAWHCGYRASEEVWEMLVRAGADPNPVDFQGVSLACQARLGGNEAFAKRVEAREAVMRDRMSISMALPPAVQARKKAVARL